jgi:carbon-monoxide dehydrogenase large subunit
MSRRCDALNQIVVCPMSQRPRSLITTPKHRLILRLGCQGVFGQRNCRAAYSGTPEKPRFWLAMSVEPFEGRRHPPRDIYLHATRTLGRPVKWTDERSESFLSDSHGRDHEMTAELALDKAGKFLALRVTGYGNLGAWLSNATTIPPTMNMVKNIIGVYATPLIEVSSKCMFTNTTPVGAYRGAGRPEGNYYMERLLETAARDMDIAIVELRRRVYILPQQMIGHPPACCMTAVNFPRFGQGLRAADWDGYAARQSDSRARGVVRSRIGPTWR